MQARQLGVNVENAEVASIGSNRDGGMLKVLGGVLGGQKGDSECGSIQPAPRKTEVWPRRGNELSRKGSCEEQALPFLSCLSGTVEAVGSVKNERRKLTELKRLHKVQSAIIGSLCNLFSARDKLWLFGNVT